MKKSILIAGSVLSLFILVSLSYQPIIAEKPKIEIIEVKTIEKEDCGCNKNNYPIILCGLLISSIIFTSILYYILYTFLFFIDDEITDRLYQRITRLYDAINFFNCPFPFL